MESNKSFNEKCYSLLKKVPKGKLATYKDIASALGTRAYRAVGNAMHKNPHAPKVPCHRVVKSNGEVGGFALGKRKKIEMLKKEGIIIKGYKVVDFSGYLYKFS
mgnify:CR=1 FL=1